MPLLAGTVRIGGAGAPAGIADVLADLFFFVFFCKSHIRLDKRGWSKDSACWISLVDNT